MPAVMVCRLCGKVQDRFYKKTSCSEAPRAAEAAV